MIAEMRLGLAFVLGLPFLSPAQAETPDSAAFTAAFGEVCIPERMSYSGTLELAQALGWRPVVGGEDAAFDGFIVHSAEKLAAEIAEDPEFLEGTATEWFTKGIGGRSHLLAVNYLLTPYLDTVGCQIYDFAASAPLDPEAVTALLGQPLAYATNAAPGTEAYDEFRVADPADMIIMAWGPPPSLPRTLDTYMTFVPQGSAIIDEAGFAGVTLTFSTSLVDRAEFDK